MALELGRTPNPPNSPLEKLVTDVPLENLEPYVRQMLAGKETVSAQDVADIFHFYNEKVRAELLRENRVLEGWANIHTHPGGGAQADVGEWDGDILLTYADADPTFHQLYQVASDSWSSQAAPPSNKRWAAGINIGAKHHVVGGIIHGGATSDHNYEFDFTTNTWTAKAVLPAAREKLSIGHYGDNVKFVAFGGVDGTTTRAREAWVFDTTANSWAALTSAPVDPVWTSGESYVAGYVWAGQRNSQNLYFYDPVADTWTLAGSLPVGYSDAQVAHHNGKLYFLSGADHLGAVIATVQEYDPETNSATNKTAKPTAGRRGGVVSRAGTFHVLGAEASAVHEAYDVTLDSWTTLTSTPTNYAGQGASVQPE